MQTKKMSLANIQGKLSRAEMKNIMAGSSCPNVSKSCCTDSDCGTGCKCYQPTGCTSNYCVTPW